MSSVLFSVWFMIQCIMQNTTCSVWFRIQRIIEKMSRVLFSIRFTIQGIIQNNTYTVWFRIQSIIKNGQGIIQHLVHDSGYYSKYDLQRLVQDSEYYSKMSRVLFSVWFTIQGIIQNTRPAAFVSRFSVMLKNVKGIIQHRVHDSEYYSK